MSSRHRSAARRRKFVTDECRQREDVLLCGPVLYSSERHSRRLGLERARFSAAAVKRLWSRIGCAICATARLGSLSHAAGIELIQRAAAAGSALAGVPLRQ
jgi:hypothetical protein